jgi:predicted nucleic acid-binding protein
MRLIVADTNPLFYLLSIGHIDLLPQLFERVLVPDAVYKELCHPAAPKPAREWVEALPPWMEVMSVHSIDDVALQSLGAGERAAITLAIALCADLILIDERKGTAVALSKGLDVTGTLGVLRLAARRGLVNLAEAFEQLKRTNFRYRQEVLDAILRQEADHNDPSNNTH